MIIDVHAHHIAPQLLEELERSGERYGVRLDRTEEPYGQAVFPGGRKSRPFFPKLCELEKRIPTLDEFGIDKQLVSTWTDVAGYDLPPDQGAAWARLQNDTMAESLVTHRDRFLMMATLPMQDMDAALREMDYVVNEYDVCAFEVGTSVNERPIGEEGFHPFWKKANELGAFVLLHPPLTPIGLDRLNRYFFKNLLGYPMDTTVAGASLIFSGLIDRLTDVKILLAHGGGFLPYGFARWDHGFKVNPDCRADSTTRPAALVDRFYYDTIVYDQRILELLLSVAPPDHVLYGTDYPFEMFDDGAVERVRNLPGLDASDVSNILGGNASQLLERGS